MLCHEKLRDLISLAAKSALLLRPSLSMAREVRTRVGYGVAQMSMGRDESSSSAKISGTSCVQEKIPGTSCSHDPKQA